MSLQSRLFRGDPKLEAAAVSDPAHIVPGAVGPHVGKIQTALRVLDQAMIPADEVRPQQYGPSTAKAVLAYKQKRAIINFNYQTQADNIVGKMTIARLDQEMIALENRRMRPLKCGDPVRASGRDAVTRVRGVLGQKSALTASSVATAAGTFSANLRIIWQPTAAAFKVAQHRHLVQVPKANQVLRPFDMEIVGAVSFPDTTLPNQDVVDVRFSSDILRVRQAAEKQRPGFRTVLRVIVCPFSRANDEYFGLTDGGTRATDPELRVFPEFILINANRMREDGLTLLHEMIHAATGLAEADHDLDSDSIFSTSGQRHTLKPDHARGLSRAFFAATR
ncbi:MAG: hypothetical protein U1G07_12390 [Verrucomicrobiota bacterium]